MEIPNVMANPSNRFSEILGTRSVEISSQFPLVR